MASVGRAVQRAAASLGRSAEAWARPRMTRPCSGGNLVEPGLHAGVACGLCRLLDAAHRSVVVPPHLVSPDAAQLQEYAWIG